MTFVCTSVKTVNCGETANTYRNELSTVKKSITEMKTILRTSSVDAASSDFQEKTPTFPWITRIVDYTLNCDASIVRAIRKS